MSEITAKLGLQRHFVDGQFVPSVAGGEFPTLNPATNAVLASAADGRAEDVDAAVRVARAAFDDGPWPGLKATERATVLRRVAALIRDRAEQFIEREVLDIGMPISQMRGLAARAAANFDYYAGVVTELHGRSFQVGEEFLNYTIRKPVGVAGLIMPWNAPLMLSTWRIAPALAWQHRRVEASGVVTSDRNPLGGAARPRRSRSACSKRGNV